MNEPIWQITWSDAMSVGISEIDEDEKHFIILVDRFNEAVTDRMDITVVRQRLQDIVDDIDRHCDEEERQLKIRQYPNLGEHTIKHNEMKQRIRYILDESIAYGTDREWIQAGLDIKQLLIEHILTEDMKYAELFRREKFE